MQPKKMTAIMTRIKTKPAINRNTDCDWNMVLVLTLTDPVEMVEKPYLLRWVPCNDDKNTQRADH